ncbi:hypothetical protein BMS3Abin04_02467 [bacterium BMS3Abin04]|nr:hypothetical protein BMS3Abin04_02467 [bacterium BMS3Abin04]
MRSKTKRVGEVLESDKSFKFFIKAAKEQEIKENFYKMFPKLKSFVRVKKIVNTTLFLSVENSVLRSELNLNKQKVIETINKYIKENLLKDIKFSK